MDVNKIEINKVYKLRRAEKELPVKIGSIWKGGADLNVSREPRVFGTILGTDEIFGAHPNEIIE